jgi:hypothetical protein
MTNEIILKNSNSIPVNGQPNAISQMADETSISVVDNKLPEILFITSILPGNVE